MLDLISARFLDRLVASPEGRAFMLRFMVDAEESDEQGVFDSLAERVDDAKLQKMVRRHQADEVVHAERLRAELARAGASVDPIPAGLRVIPYMDRALGGVTAGTVMEQYLALLVIEERAVERYPLIAAAFRRAGEARTASVIEEIADDEQRHVKYARAISKRYAPDPLTLMRTTKRYRDAEARAFEEHGAAFLRWAVDHDRRAVGLPERILWKTFARLAA